MTRTGLDLEDQNQQTDLYREYDERQQRNDPSSSYKGSSIVALPRLSNGGDTFLVSIGVPVLVREVVLRVSLAKECDHKEQAGEDRVEDADW